MKVQMISGAADMGWLRDTHMQGVDIAWAGSAVLHGNEDCPQKIELYDAVEPLVTDTPVVFQRHYSGAYREEKPYAGHAHYKTARFRTIAFQTGVVDRTYDGFVGVQYAHHANNPLRDRDEPVYWVRGKGGEVIGSFFEGALQDFCL